MKRTTADRKNAKAAKEFAAANRTTTVKLRAKWEAEFLRQSFDNPDGEDGEADLLLYAVARTRSLLQTLATVAERQGALTAADLDACAAQWLESAGCDVEQSRMGQWLVVRK